MSSWQNPSWKSIIDEMASRQSGKLTKWQKNCIFQVKNLKKRGVKKPKVFTLHKDLPIQGGWTITPLTTLLIDVIYLPN